MDTRFFRRIALLIREEDLTQVMQEVMDDSSLKIEHDYPVLSMYSEDDVVYDTDDIIDKLSNYLGKDIVDIHWSKSNGTIYLLTTENEKVNEKLPDNLVINENLWLDGKPHMAPLPDNLVLDEALFKENEI